MVTLRDSIASIVISETFNLFNYNELLIAITFTNSFSHFMIFLLCMLTLDLDLRL